MNIRTGIQALGALCIVLTLAPSTYGYGPKKPKKKKNNPCATSLSRWKQQLQTLEDLPPKALLKSKNSPKEIEKLLFQGLSRVELDRRRKKVKDYSGLGRALAPLYYDFIEDRLVAQILGSFSRLKDQEEVFLAPSCGDAHWYQVGARPAYRGHHPENEKYVLTGNDAGEFWLIPWFHQILQFMASTDLLGRDLGFSSKEVQTATERSFKGYMETLHRIQEIPTSERAEWEENLLITSKNSRGLLKDYFKVVKKLSPHTVFARWVKQVSHHEYEFIDHSHLPESQQRILRLDERDPLYQIVQVAWKYSPLRRKLEADDGPGSGKLLGLAQVLGKGNGGWRNLIFDRSDRISQGRNYAVRRLYILVQVSSKGPLLLELKAQGFPASISGRAPELYEDLYQSFEEPSVVNHAQRVLEGMQALSHDPWPMASTLDLKWSSRSPVLVRMVLPSEDLPLTGLEQLKGMKNSKKKASKDDFYDAAEDLGQVMALDQMRMYRKLREQEKYKKWLTPGHLADHILSIVQGREDRLEATLMALAKKYSEVVQYLHNQLELEKL